MFCQPKSLLFSMARGYDILQVCAGGWDFYGLHGNPVFLLSVIQVWLKIKFIHQILILVEHWVMQHLGWICIEHNHRRLLLDRGAFGCFIFLLIFLSLFAYKTVNLSLIIDIWEDSVLIRTGLAVVTERLFEFWLKRIFFIFAKPLTKYWNYINRHLLKDTRNIL